MCEEKLDIFFKPKSIVLIGASHTEEKLGGVILKNLLRFRGRVYPVNPNYPELMGLKAYPSVHHIPESVDLAIIMRPAAEVPSILRDIEGKAKGVIIPSSGFAEIGQKELQDEVAMIGKKIGIRILGPNCMGLYNPYQALDTFFLPPSRLKRPKKGNVAVISQSGAILSCILGTLMLSNIGISTAVGYGNAVDIDESDIFEYLADDRRTDVVISYIESLGNGRKFIEKAKFLSEKKSFILIKAGKGVSGQAAAFSHTGRLAGRYEVFHSILKQFNIKEAMDFDEVMDAAKALSFQRPSKGKRICIITNGGGSGVLAADECMRQGLDVTGLSEEKKKALKEIFPDFYGINNPLDLTAQVRDKDYILAIKELKDDYDGFVVIALPNVPGITENLPGMINELKEVLDKPIVFHIAYSSITKRLTLMLENNKIPVYSSPERAVRGLKALLD